MESTPRGSFWSDNRSVLSAYTNGRKLMSNVTNTNNIIYIYYNFILDCIVCDVMLLFLY